MSTDLDLVEDPRPDPDEQAPPVPLIEGLTAMQTAFVHAYIEHGDGNATKAALAAGYASVSAAAVGYRLLHHEGVLRAISAETVRRFAPHAPVALKTMARLAAGAKSEFVQQQAAADLLDRAGFKPPDRVQHLHGGNVSFNIDLGTG